RWMAAPGAHAPATESGVSADSSTTPALPRKRPSRYVARLGADFCRRFIDRFSVRHLSLKRVWLKGAPLLKARTLVGRTPNTSTGSDSASGDAGGWAKPPRTTS